MIELNLLQKSKNMGYAPLLYAIYFLSACAKEYMVEVESVLTSEERENFYFYNDKPVDPKTLSSDIERGQIKKKLYELYKLIGIV